MTMTPIMQAEGSLVPLPLLEMIPSGYYAVRPDDETPYVFCRLARPSYGRLKGWVKFQTQHAETLMDRWLWNPENPDPRTCVRQITWGRNGRLHNQSPEDLLLLLIVDHRKAARAYSHEIKKCHRCNIKLTDERSRWYGFGPECEGSLEGEKDEIDDENGGTYEALRERSDPIYLQWKAEVRA